jgi:hypothetical protein
MLFHPRNVVCTSTLPFSVVCVQWPVWLFLLCISLILYVPDMLLKYCKSDFEIVPVDPIITGIAFDFTLHIHWLSIMRSLYFKIFSAYFLIKLLSPQFVTSIKCIFLFYYHRLTSSLLLRTVLSVHTCRFHNLVNGHTNVCCLIWLQFPFFFFFYCHYYYYYCSVCTFSKLQKATITFVLSVHMQQFSSHCTDFHEIWEF